MGAVVIAMLVFLRPGRTTDTITRLYLMLSLGWVGVVFFLILGKGLAGNKFIGTLFTITAVLFAVDLFR